MKLQPTYHRVFKNKMGGVFAFSYNGLWCRLSVRSNGRLIICGLQGYKRSDLALIMLHTINVRRLPEPLKSTIKLYRQTLRHRAAGIAARRRRRE